MCITRWQKGLQWARSIKIVPALHIGSKKISSSWGLESMTIAAATVGRSETGKYFVLADAALPSPEFPTGNGKVDLQVTVVMLSWV